jgi:hypothetical protein
MEPNTLLARTVLVHAARRQEQAASSRPRTRRAPRASRTLALARRFRSALVAFQRESTDEWIRQFERNSMRQAVR